MMRCPTHRYTGDAEPTISCPTCFAIWIGSCHTTSEQARAAWMKVNAKGMRVDVQQMLRALWVQK